MVYRAKCVACGDRTDHGGLCHECGDIISAAHPEHAPGVPHDVFAAMAAKVFEESDGRFGEPSESARQWHTRKYGNDQEIINGL